MSHIKKIVLTGGPCGGKSTTLRYIEQIMPDVFCAPEAATMLLSGGFPAPDSKYRWDYGWQKNFQRAVAAAQIAIESEFERRADLTNVKAILYDRGILDGASYLRGGIRELEDLTNMSEACMLERYDTVLHLPSSAVTGIAKYNKASNAYRLEEAEQALILEDRVLDAWQNHQNRAIVDCTIAVATLIQVIDHQ